VPQHLGWYGLTQGTARPYPHSLLTVGLILALAAAWPRGRMLLLGAAAGLIGHFFRDLSETHTGVPLLWPWSDHSFSSPHPVYLGVMGGLFLIACVRAGAFSRVRGGPSIPENQAA
jgi:membrane-bound metal-dependent hydrolase YbcI (DUF457 family)